MRPSRLRLDPRRLLALTSLVQLVLAGCNGEEAFKARDAGALLGTGGGAGVGSGGAGGLAPGTGGRGGLGGGVAGAGGSATGGTTVGTGGTAGTGTSTGGQGGDGGGATGGTGGQAGMGGAAGGSGGRPGSANGTHCSADGECSSNHCTDGVCCEAACAGTCTACVMTKTGQLDGLCRPIPATMDPDSECKAQPMSTCGISGNGCNGTGACAVYPINTPCGSMQMCTTDFAGVIPGQVCNGGGACVNAAAQSCNGFACAGAVCGTTCTSDAACAKSGFCSASACIAVPNLAGNGGAETNTTTGWLPANGGKAPQVSATAASGYAHTGQYSIVETSRSAFYVGPAYNLPTGLGQYTISFWTMQTDDLLFYGVPQIELKCYDGQHPAYLQLLTDFSVTMTKANWVQVSATVDTSTNSSTRSDCFATGATPGLVRSAFLYMNQVTTDPTQNGYDIPSPTEYPNIYMDDVVIQAPAGQNLVGNPNFEAGFPDGWAGSAGAPTPAVTTTFAHGGTSSLLQSARTSPAAGIQYALPIGAARYQVSAWVMQAGTKPHPLVMQPSYSCIAGTGPTATMNAAPIVLPGDGNAIASNWIQISGTVVMPPADAPAGCVMSQATLTLQQNETGACSTVECPDLYLDDVSIALN
jgi:hypothetical protein